MLERHEYLRSGVKVDRHWWYAVKFGAMVFAALAARPWCSTRCS